MFDRFIHFIRKVTATRSAEWEGHARMTLIDADTGETLDEKKLKTYARFFNPFKHNMATLDSRKGHAHLLIPGDNDYKLTRVEWGYGSNIAQRSNTDLSGPFTPAVYTNISGYTFPTSAENVLKITTMLTNEVLSLPPSSSYPFVREVALRSNPNSLHPKGLMFAHFVADADIPKTTEKIYIGLEWLYIFN